MALQAGMSMAKGPGVGEEVGSVVTGWLDGVADGEALGMDVGVADGEALGLSVSITLSSNPSLPKSVSVGSDVGLEVVGSTVGLGLGGSESP